MTLPSLSAERTLNIYLALAQYPILSTSVRARMRRELFKRGVITPQAFEAEARDKAVRSQAMEGVRNPFTEEPAEVWELRLTRVRDHLTDFYFAYNLPYELFEQLVREALTEGGAEGREALVSFNPELAPQSMLFEQAMAIERMPPEARAQAEARLREIKVVLIRTLVSDQLAYVNVAKDWFTISDLDNIRERKVGQGKIGGKSAGMLLAARILIDAGDDDIRSSSRIPDSYFIGADMTYEFMSMNKLMHWLDQKYKSEEQIRAEFPHLQQEFLDGEFPPDFVDKLRGLLELIGRKPLIVRSSSLLEDNFGTSFAGKYESHFCPNQDTLDKNLARLTEAIIRIYASIFNPDALLYRRAKGLQDYDERMAILIQVVEGERNGKYFMPHAAGVAFSRNLWGLGTRAVDRVGNDYPRLVALSHPLLHPSASPKDIHHYSQHFVDLIDLEENAFKSLPVQEVLSPRNPLLRYLAQIDDNGYLAHLHSMMVEAHPDQLVLTFDGLLSRTSFAVRLRNMLRLLEESYHTPVDTEFTARILNPQALQPEVEITLLQCRPQSHLKESEVRLPQNLQAEDIIFSSPRMAPEGHVSGIRYVLFITPEGYYSLPTQAARAELSTIIGRLNAALAGETFIGMAPGRWGTSNPDLGVRVGYGDIYHTRALVELTGKDIGSAPEASFGTHFFQDLMESAIYPLAIYLQDPGVIFNREFFYNTANHLADFLPDSEAWRESIRIIRVADFRAAHHLELVMDDEAGLTVAFLEAD
jgi:hypothetical protein